MEDEPERGIRCTMCFDMRFERTALYAHEHGFSLISSSLEFLVGKIWLKLMIVEFGQHPIIQIFNIGIITGEKWWLKSND